MSTNPSASRVQLNLPRFDGFPYLITRVVSGFYHIIVIPARQRAESYQELLLRQGEANRLETSLVLDARTAWFWSPNGDLARTSQPPTGGIIVTDRLQPCEAFDRTPDLSARHTRLERFVEARKPGGYMLGDLTKGGRPATPEECHRLAGFDADGVPNGLQQCGDCGDWRGQCLDPSPNFAGEVMQVHCRCENDNRCARCGSLLAERKLNANYYRESDRQIWHVPGFVGLSHCCPGVSQKGSVEGKSGPRSILTTQNASHGSAHRHTIENEPVRVNLTLLFQATIEKRNLALAFLAALEVDRKLIAELDEAGTLDDKYEFWTGDYEENGYSGWDAESEEEFTHPLDETVLTLLGKAPENLIELYWFSPMNCSGETYKLVRDLAGYDILYSDHVEHGWGYPILLMRPTGEPGFDEAVVAKICSDAPLWNATTITNWRPDIVPGERILRTLRAHPDWPDDDELAKYWKESYTEEPRQKNA